MSLLLRLGLIPESQGNPFPQNKVNPHLVGEVGGTLSPSKVSQSCPFPSLEREGSPDLLALVVEMKPFTSCGHLPG